MRKLTLTAEHIAKIQRTEPDEGPRPDREQMTDADYNQWADDLLEELTGTSLRIFAYGSLIWKPEFEYVASSRAWLHGCTWFERCAEEGRAAAPDRERTRRR